MIKKIKQFFNEIAQLPAHEKSDDLTIEMACTVLLCEVMNADGHLATSEVNQLTELLSNRFQLSQSEVKALIELAIVQSEQATDFYQFTSKINQHFSIEDKIRLMQQLWLLALADGNVSAIEEHMIRKIADLLHLRHHEAMRAKAVILKDN